MPIKSWSDLISDAGGANGDYAPIPDGDYDFVVKEATAKQAQSGKMMYVAKCEVQGGPHEKRLVWHNFVVSPENPSALSWFFRNMGVLGLDGRFFATDPSDHQVADALNGKRFRGQVTTRTWQGQEKNEIKQFWSPRSSGAPSAGPAPSPAPAPAPAPASRPAPAPAYAAPAATEAAPPAPAQPAAPPAPPVQQQNAPAPATDAAPPAAPPAPATPPQAAGATPPPPPF